MKHTKIILCVLIICIYSGINKAQFKNQLSLQHNSVILIDTNKNTPKLSEKDPLLAGTLSFIVPGFAIGQYYNGQINKFFVHSLISTGLILSFISLHGKFSDINFFGRERTGSIGSIAYMLAYSTNWIWSIVDAIVSAKEINKQVILQKYRSESPDKIRLGFSLDQNKKLRLNFAIGL